MIKKIIKGISNGISLWFSTMDEHHTWSAFTLYHTNIYVIFLVIISVFFLPLIEGNIDVNIMGLVLGVPLLMTFVDGVKCLRRGDIHAVLFYIISMSCVFMNMYNAGAEDIVLLIVNVALMMGICFLKVSQQCKRFFISSNAVMQFTTLILYVHQFGNPTLLWLCISVSILGLIGIIIDLIIHFKNDKIILYTALVHIVLLLFISVCSCSSRIIYGDTWSYDSAVEDPFPIYRTTVDDSFDSVPELRGMSMKGLDRKILPYLNAFIDNSAYGIDFKKPAQSRLKNFERVEHMRLNPLDTIKVFICRESNSTDYPYVFWNRNDTIVEETTSTYTLGDTSHPTISLVESYPFKLMNAGKLSIKYLPDGYNPCPIVHDICYAFYLYVNNGVIEKAFSYSCFDVMVDPDLKCLYFYR